MAEWHPAAVREYFLSCAVILGVIGLCDKDPCLVPMSDTPSLCRHLYRAMWRATRTPAVKNSRFRLPYDEMPDHVASLARKLRLRRNQQGLQGLVHAAWRQGAAWEAMGWRSRRVGDHPERILQAGATANGPRRSP